MEIYSKHKRVYADLIMAFVAMSWGVAFPVMKGLLGPFSVFSLLTVRFVLAALLVSVFYCKAFQSLTSKEVLKSFALGFCLSIGFILLILGLQYTSASKAGFILATSIIWVPFFEWIFFKKAINFLMIVSALICLIGMCFLFSINKLNGGFGDLLVVLGTLVFSFQMILFDQFAPMKNPAITAIQLLLTGIISAVAGYLFGDFKLPQFISVGLMANLFFLAVVATAFTVWAQTRFQYLTTPTRTAFIFLLEPIFALIFSYILLCESLSSSEIIGVVIILMGLLISIRSTY